MFSSFSLRYFIILWIFSNSIQQIFKVSWISVSFLTRGSVIDQRNEIKLVPKINIKTSDTQITPNRAKEIALAHAGVSEAAANFKKIKLDNKNGKSIYEIEFIANKSRYEFIVDAKNGSIIKFEKR